MSEERDFFADRGFGQSLGFGDKPAVICIDFMNAFTDPTHPLGSSYDAEIDIANTVVEAARHCNLPVFHTVVSYDHPNILDAGLWRIKQKGSWRLQTGSQDVGIDSRLQISQEDQVLVKKYASAFFGTDLLSRLVSQGIDTLILLGFTTSGCIRATAVDAVQSGIRPIVVRDGVGDRSELAHQQSLFDLEQKYADVLGATEVNEHLLNMVRAQSRPKGAR